MKVLPKQLSGLAEHMAGHRPRLSPGVTRCVQLHQGGTWWGMLMNAAHAAYRLRLFPGVTEELANVLQFKWGNIPRYVLEKVGSHAELFAECPARHRST